MSRLIHLTVDGTEQERLIVLLTTALLAGAVSHTFEEAAALPLPAEASAQPIANGTARKAKRPAEKRASLIIFTVVPPPRLDDQSGGFSNKAGR